MSTVACTRGTFPDLIFSDAHFVTYQIYSLCQRVRMLYILEVRFLIRLKQELHVISHYTHVK